MTLCNDFQINGSPLVVPDENISLSRSDVESSDTGKDESGVLHRYLLRSKVRKWSFKYSHMSKEEYEYMENLLGGKATFTFKFPQSNGAVGQCTAYCPSAAIAIRNIKTGQYSSYSFDVVEC